MVTQAFSVENNMDPGHVPLCLEGLTQVEQMLIAQGFPVMCVYRKKKWVMWILKKKSRTQFSLRYPSLPQLPVQLCQ